MTVLHQKQQQSDFTALQQHSLQPRSLPLVWCCFCTCVRVVGAAATGQQSSQRKKHTSSTHSHNGTHPTASQERREHTAVHCAAVTWATLSIVAADRCSVACQPPPSHLTSLLLLLLLLSLCCRPHSITTVYFNRSAGSTDEHAVKSSEQHACLCEECQLQRLISLPSPFAAASVQPPPCLFKSCPYCWWD